MGVAIDLDTALLRGALGFGLQVGLHTLVCSVVVRSCNKHIRGLHRASEVAVL